MLQYPIYTEESECQGCYKCVGRCPVKSIRVKDGLTDIIPKICIYCGNCVTSCPAGAKRVRNDIEKVQRLIKRGVKVYASLAPSYASEFYGSSPAQVISSLKKLGFAGISETALGADFVSADIAADLEKEPTVFPETGQRLFLSSACPSVVMYIKQNAPAYIPYLNDRASPLLSHALFLRKIYGDKIAVVFIGPCIAKKREADQFREINAAITFAELKQWFAQDGIVPENTEVDGGDTDFVPRRAAKGSYYPVDGGMILSLKSYQSFSKGPTASPVSNMVVSGINTIAELLHGNLAPEHLPAPLFLELLACSGGCINGPCATRDTSAIMRRAQLLQYAQTADDKLDPETLKDGLVPKATLTLIEKPRAKFSVSEIRGALRKIGIYGADDALNCGQCGYEDCRSFAAAMLEKRAEKVMCASYMRNMAQRKANAMIKTSPSGIVLVDKTLHVLESNKNFARLMGKEIEELYELIPELTGINLNKIIDLVDYFEDALMAETASSFDYDIRYNKKVLHLNVYVIEKGEVFAAVIDDITVPQVRRDKTVAKARKIIEKNVQAVQKIAFLLGENAAETEAILNTIIESHSQGD
ncbi:hydrogenase [Spirochaetia bacterium]|nr:hydrogenase [Spirochaetia bacterium]